MDLWFFSSFIYNGLILNYNSLLKKGFTKNNPARAGNIYSTKDIKIPKLNNDWYEANSEKKIVISPSLTPKPEIVIGNKLIIIITGKNRIILEKGMSKLRALDKI